MRGSAELAALARVPDLAQWVDTRGMLLSGFARVRFSEPADFHTDGFVVILAPRALVSVVGRPPTRLIFDAAQHLPRADVLCPIEDVSYTSQALPEWRKSCAVLHVLGGAMPGKADDDTTIFMQDTAPGAHPLQVARTDFAGISHGVSMPDGPPEQISHRFYASMGMKRKTRLVISWILRLKMIQKQKWIYIIQRMAADTPFEPNSRAFHDSLRFHNLSYSSRVGFHRCTSRLADFTLPSSNLDTSTKAD